MSQSKNINLSNEEIERKELLEWIPTLVKEKLNIMTTEQLRILHYVLGYDCSEVDTALLAEEFEQNGYDENTANTIIATLKRDNFLIIEKPY